MLRKLVAVMSAVFVTAALAVTSAAASELPGVSFANRGHGKPPLVPTPPAT